jgi:membrane-associated protein
MDLLLALWSYVAHLDRHLGEFLAQYGGWVYALLFAIVFCETGLVVTPFLPGDSLLFVVGALAAAGGLELPSAVPLLVCAALCGDNTNYWIGRWIGPRVFHFPHSRWFNRKGLERTHAFYERHGGKALVLARFVPLVRTFAPFVAGVGTMRYLRFLAFSFAGASLWVGALTFAGYHFGNIPVVRQNLALGIVAVVAISVLPILVGYLRHRLARRGA